MIYLILVSLFTVLRAGAVTFQGVPDRCQNLLTEVIGEGSDVVVDWRPWASHLRELGYADDWIDHLISNAHARPLRDEIRKALDKPSWQWADGLSEEDNVALASIESSQPLPFEYLAHVAGFNVTTVINAQLADAILSHSWRRRLAQTAPFWAIGPHGRDLAEAYVRSLSDPADRVNAHRWLVSYFETRGMRAPELFIKGEDEKVGPPLRHQEYLLMALDHVPLTSLAEEDQRLLRRKWLRHKDYPPLLNQNVRAVSFGRLGGMNCQDMALGFLRLLEHPVVSFDPVKDELIPPLVVRLRGQVVGVIKSEHNSTMLALRSVRDRAGYLVLMQGGVYRIPREIDLGVEPSTDAALWPKIDVDHLTVTPLGPVLNHHAWTLQNLKLIFAYLIPLDREDTVALLREVSETLEEEAMVSTRARFHRRVWPLVLTRIDRLRAHLEGQR